MSLVISSFALHLALLAGGGGFLSRHLTGVVVIVLAGLSLSVALLTGGAAWAEWRRTKKAEVRALTYLHKRRLNEADLKDEGLSDLLKNVSLDAYAANRETREAINTLLIKIAASRPTRRPDARLD